MTALIVQFAVLAAIIVVAGSFLTRYGDTLGERTGMGGSLAGLILLAGATSLPELTVDSSAALLGAANLAVGDLMGSSLFNLLILAVLDMSIGPRGRMLSKMAAAHALSATMSVVLIAIAALAIVVDNPQTWLGVGLGPWVMLLVYLCGMRLVFFDQRYALASGEERPAAAESKLSLSRAVWGFLAATAVIFVTAPALARTADALAEQTGLGGTFVGTTLVALSTSLPELVTTLAAVRMGAHDLAVGNIFGSNSFNMAMLAVIDGFYAGPLLHDVSLTHGVTALCAVIITAVAVMGLLYRAEKRYWMIEPDATLVILLVLGSLYLVYLLRNAA